MQKVINGEDPISLDMHQQFFQWTSLQREKASLTHVHAFGDWHETLIYAIQEFLEAWSKKEQVGSRSAVSFC